MFSEASSFVLDEANDSLDGSEINEQVEEEDLDHIFMEEVICRNPSGK